MLLLEDMVCIIWSYDIDEVPQVSDFFFTTSDNCVDTEITFEFNIPFEYDELNVEWGDGNSDTFTNSVTNYTYLLQGNYSVSVEVIRGCENFQLDSTLVVEVCNVDVIDFIVLGIYDETSPIGIQIPQSTTFDKWQYHLTPLGEAVHITFMMSCVLDVTLK